MCVCLFVFIMRNFYFCEVKAKQNENFRFEKDNFTTTVASKCILYG